MKKRSLFLGILLFPLCLFSQVGIGTTTPAFSSMLEVSSQTDGSGRYKGFMPPRVPDEAARNAIAPSVDDAGLLVYVMSTHCLEIWNGIEWEIVKCSDAAITFVAIQDFDQNTSWNYVPYPEFYNDGPPDNDIWDIVNSLPNITYVSGYFLGCRDLDNPRHTGITHTLTFDNVTVTGVANPKIAFDYDVFEFDQGDYVDYEVFHDNISQGRVRLITGNNNYSEFGTRIINIPNNVNQVRFILHIRQNGDTDFAGFDNFMVYGTE